MDQLIIKNLELFAYHGVNPEEKAMGQKFLLDAVLDVDLSLAGETDNLDYAVNYAKLCHDIQDIFGEAKDDLIERAATRIVQHILSHYTPINGVDLTLKKPWAPVHLPIEYPAVRIHRRWHQAYIALGSNIGDREETLKKAIKHIDAQPHTGVIKTSTFIETEPVGYVDQDAFINAVIEIKTWQTPTQLMDFLLGIETQLNRVRTIRWGPRTIDLDILYYDNCVTDDEHVLIPHPRMHERTFVLEPLNELAPNKLHPLLKKRTYELLDALTPNN